MSFGFNLFLIFILLPVTVAFLIAELFSRKGSFLKSLGWMWLAVFALVIFSFTVQWFTSITELEKEDYYGEYTVCRSCYPGKQADWQYDHFRFEIRENDSIYFHVTDKERIVQTYRGSIRTTKAHISERLIVEMERPGYHILTSDPTVYRGHKKFYLVFRSPKFGNVFFRKGSWKPH